MQKLSCQKNNHADADSPIFLMSTPIPFLGNAGNLVPDGIVAGLGSRKCKQAFSLSDPDNIELGHLVTQAAKNSSEKEQAKVDDTQMQHLYVSKLIVKRRAQ